MSGIAILKEPSTYLAVSMAGFALSSMATVDDERHRLWRDIVLFVLACVLMAFVRTTFLYFFALGVIIMALPNWRRDWMLALGMLLVLTASLLVGDHYAAYSFSRHAEIVQGGWNMQRFYVMVDSQQFYHDFLNYYFLYSTGHKLLMLPLTVSVQFITPFPWLIYEEPTFTNYVARIGYGWYLIGGIAAFYYLFLSWRRRENMGAWAWWPALAFIIIAYVMAGSVTRYVLPFQPLFIPVVVFMLCRLYKGGRWAKSFKRWSIFFVILLAVTLVVCFELQTKSVSSMLNTRPLEEILRNIFVMADPL